jgi:M6 family metalloprotease-like protein/uncharacterized repeat protein (TIGR01451 family)
MKNVLRHYGLSFLKPKTLASLAAGFVLTCGMTVRVPAAPFDRQIEFTQPDGARVQLHGQGDEFHAVFETPGGYTVVFDPAQRAYCFAQLAADGQLVSSGVQVHLGNPAVLGLSPGLRMSPEARKRSVIERWQRWEQGMQIQQRWEQQKAAARRFYEPGGPQSSPPPFTTTGLKVGLTLLVDFSDDPATVAQAEIINFCNGNNYTGSGNNGSVKSYYYDNSNGQLTYTNVVTVYVRAPQAKTVYNDTTLDCGDQANILIKDVLDTLKALPDYNTVILPTLGALTVDADNEVVACNVFYAGGNGGVWMFGLWPHSWSLYNVGAQPLGNGKSVNKYQITDIGSQLELGTFCHENGHMLCGYPDIYDYDYDSSGGAGGFCLMNSGGNGGNPVQICAYLKRASGWATVTELDQNSSLVATVTATAGVNFNHFYRFQKPGVPTEYYLAENRQQRGRDAAIPGSGVALWHIDELGDRDNQSTNYNTTHANYECSLVQADNQFDLQRNQNEGDAQDLYYAGNPAAGYANQFSDTNAPSARWWDGSPSGVVFTDFSAKGDTMTFQVGAALLSIVGTTLAGGNGNGVIDPNECNDLYIVLTNRAASSAVNVRGRLSTTTPGVAFGVRASNYPDIPANGSGQNLVPFTISTSPEFVCGTPIALEVVIQADQGSITNALVLSTGTAGTPARFDSTLPVAIPDANPEGTNSIITVSSFAAGIAKATVSLHLTHTNDSDLTLSLIAPDGTTNLLAASRGGADDNYGTNCANTSRTKFDDDAALDIGSASAPFLGTFKPEQPLAVYNGRSGTNVNGQWKLHVVDNRNKAVGTIQCWSLVLSPQQCTDGGGTCPGADLAIGMNAAPDPVVSGSNLVYTIMVTNNGPGSAPNTVVNHVLPGGVTFVSAVASQGACVNAAGTVICSLGTLTLAGVATITVTVAPTTPGTISSTATVTSQESDFDASNNSATVSTHVYPFVADLAVGLADAPDPIMAGGTLTYTLTVTNNGPSAASGVWAIARLPSSVSVLSATPSQGSATIFGKQVICNFGTLAKGTRAVATIGVTPINQGTIYATATVAGNDADPIAGNNTATATTTVGPAADLAITLSDVPDPVVVGGNWNYTVTVVNQGAIAANAVVMNATLPATLTIVSTNTTQGTLSRSGNTISCTMNSLNAGSAAVITIVVNSSSSGVFNATATVTAAQADPDLANNTAGETTTVAPPNVSVVAASATLTGESFPPPNGAVDVGETVTVQLRLRNTGNVNTTNLVATLLATGGVIPQGGTQQTYGVLSAGGPPVGRPFSFTASGANGGTVVATLQLWEGPASLGTATFTFALAKVWTFANANTITIPDSGTASPYPSTINVSGVTGLLDKVTVTLANLNHTFIEDVDVLLVGPNGQKVMLMSDCGNPAAVANTTVTLDDAAAAALPDDGQIFSGSYQSADYEPGDSFAAPAPGGAPGTALAIFKNTDPNGTWSLYIVDDASGDFGAVSNGWSLNFTTVNPLPPTADLAATMTRTADPLYVGNALVYTIGVTNFGPSPATAVTVTNVLAAGLNCVSNFSSVGTVNVTGNVVKADLGTLAPDAGAVITIHTILLTTGNFVSTTVVAANETDPDLANNFQQAVALVKPVADLALTISEAPDSLYVGSVLTYSIGVTNLGPSLATGVTVTDALPSGLHFVSSSSSQGTVGMVADVVTANVGTLSPGAGAVITIQTTPTLAGNFTNSASVAGIETDLNLANNTAQTSTLVNPAADLVVTITDAPDPLYVGGTLVYTIGVTNLGPSPATGVTVTDTLPAGLSYVSSSTSQGTVGAVGNLVTANVGNLAVGGGAVLTIQTTPTVAGNFVNAASVARNETDLNPANNTAQTSTLVNPAADLGVTIATTPDPLYVGGTLVYTIGVTNLGPSPATGVTVTDTLPAGLSYVSSLSSQGTIGAVGNLVTANVGDLAVGGGAVLTIQTTPTLASNFVNAASVVRNETDLNPANNTAQTSTLVNPAADLAVTIATTPDPLYVGSTLTYTITVANLGPSPATGVTVTNTLPAGLSYVSSSSSQGTIGAVGNLVTANVGNLAVGGGAVVTIQTTPTSAGNFVNAASVAGNETDLNPANNTAQTSTLVSPAADLAMAVVDSPDPVLLGNGLTYTLFVTNLGQIIATNVTVANTLPAGVSFVSATPSGYTLAGGVVTFTNLGNLGTGETASAIIAVQANVEGTLTNTAACSSSGPDPLLGNNSVSVNTLVEALRLGISLVRSNLTRPRLSVSAVSNNLVIAWPADATAYDLESTASLTPPAVWTPVTSPPPVIAGGQKTVTLSPAGGVMFFRLWAPASSLPWDGDYLVITWPAIATGYLLDGATNLIPPVVWSPVTNSPVTVGNEQMVTVPAFNDSGFFRLRIGP